MDDSKQEKLKKFYNNQTGSSYSELMNELEIGEHDSKRKKIMKKLDFNNLNVLEIGFGQGYNLEFYRKANSITGLDISSSMLFYSERRINRLELKDKTTLLEWDCRILKEEFIDKFDIIIFSYSLSGAPDQELIFQNALKYCKKDGIIGILDCDTLFEGNKKYILNKKKAFLNKTINYFFGTIISGFSSYINPWKFIYKNRKSFNIVFKEVDEATMLILQKK